MEFDEILERFKKRRMGPGEAAESTADRYVRHVRNWRNWLAKNGNKTVWEAEYDDLRLFAEELVYQDMAPTTISQRVSAISKFYQDAKKFPDYLDIPEVPENPYDGFDKDDKKLLRGDTKKKTGLKDSEKDEYPYLESEEVEKLVENVPAPRLRNELIIKLLYHIGFRRGELAKAKIKHIDRTDRSVYIPPRKSPEGRHIAYKQDYLGFQLDRWIDHDRDSMTYASESDYLFPTNNNEHISADYIGKVVKKAAENAGLQETIAEYSDGRKLHKVTAHTLRHSYAMRTLKTAEDVDIRTLQSLLGHEELDTTLIYLQQSKEEAKEASRGFVP
ncbi:tyrosine-type recombinase/integrase [Halorientalis persicus]|nr:tyrosine-type recombinase/integrase [Halorientalis persicus]